MSSTTREDPPLQAPERPMLAAWLDYHRATLLGKCQGLTGPQLAETSVLPSTMTLLGLVRHMTLVEWWWFEHVFAAGGAPEPIDTTVDPDADFNGYDPAEAAADLAAFDRQCAHSRGIVDGAVSLDVLSVSSERAVRDLRWIVVHMIEEYARHNGHADLLRQSIDGAVGE